MVCGVEGHRNETVLFQTVLSFSYCLHFDKQTKLSLIVSHEPQSLFVTWGPMAEVVYAFPMQSDFNDHEKACPPVYKLTLFPALPLPPSSA